MKALFSEIRERLEGECPASAIADTLSKVRAEIERQRAARARHEAKTIDLLADHADVMAADRALGEAILNERRLVEADRLLTLRHTVRAEIEDEAARAESYRNARRVRDAAVAEISRAYTAHANGLAALVSQIADADAEIARACSRLPRGAEPIGGVLDGLHSFSGVPNVHRSIVEHLSIPAVPQWDVEGFKGSQVMRL